MAWCVVSVQWIALLAQLLLLLRVHGGSIASASATPRDMLLNAVLDAEIGAAHTYMTHLEAKATLLHRMIHLEQDLLKKMEAPESNENASTRRSPHRPPNSHRRFDDWLAPQPPWLSPTARSANLSSSSSVIHMELITFRPSGNVGGKKNSHATRLGPEDPARPVLQFLMVLNTNSGALDLFHPSSHELVWQQRLEIPAPITSVHFYSDRAAYLALVMANGEVLLYAMRIYHGRRLVAGDYRRFSGTERLWCPFNVRLPTQDRGSVTNSSSVVLRPWDDHYLRASQVVPRSLSPAGLHPHVEMELIFVTRSPTPPALATIVVSYQTFYVVTGDSGGQLTFFHGQNGSLIETLSTQLGPISQFQVLSSGVVAFAVANRIHFVDVYDRRLLDLTCEGSHYNITSMVRDSWRHTALYVGSSDGSGLAFRINRFGSIKRNNGLVALGADVEGLNENDFGRPTCTLTAQLKHRAPSFGDILPTDARRRAIVTALPGYVLLTSGSKHLVLYETASSHTSAPVYLTEKMLAASQVSPFAQIVSVNGASDLFSNVAAIAITIWEPMQSRVRVELMTSLLPAQSSSLDIGWIRAPMMLLCAIGVMFWQQNRVRRPSSSSSLEFDFPAMRNHQKGHGSRSDWSRSTNHRTHGGF